MDSREIHFTNSSKVANKASSSQRFAKSTTALRNENLILSLQNIFALQLSSIFGARYLIHTRGSYRTNLVDE